MSNYLFISSRDSLDDISVERNLDLMLELLLKNHNVELMLVQDGIYTAQERFNNKSLRYFLGKGGKVHVDDFSLSLREIAPDSLVEGVIINSISIVIDALIGKNKVIWC